MKKNKHFVPMTAGAIALGTIIYIKKKKIRKENKPNRLWAVNDITMTYHRPNCKFISIDEYVVHTDEHRLIELGYKSCFYCKE